MTLLRSPSLPFLCLFFNLSYILFATNVPAKVSLFSIFVVSFFPSPPYGAVPRSLHPSIISHSPPFQLLRIISTFSHHFPPPALSLHQPDNPILSSLTLSPISLSATSLFFHICASLIRAPDCFINHTNIPYASPAHTLTHTLSLRCTPGAQSGQIS